MYNEWLIEFANIGAIRRNDHFVYASGLHGPAYVDKRAIAVYPPLVSRIAQALAERIGQLMVEEPVSAIVAPAVGAIVFGSQVAKRFPEALFFIAEKEADGFSIKTLPQLLDGRTTVVVEDILTTGGSAKRTVDVARDLGANVVAVAALVNRGGVSAQDLGVGSLISLVEVEMPMYEADECPLCTANVPINTKLGHGAKFLTEKE